MAGGGSPFSRERKPVSNTHPNLRLVDVPPEALTPLFATSLYPEQTYPALREQWGNVAPVELDGGVPAWLVLEWDDCLRVMREGNFSRDVTHWKAFQDGQVQPGTGLYAFFMPRDNAYYTDGTRQERLRQVVDDAFTTVNEHNLAADMRAACDQMLAHVVRDGRTSADLVTEYTTFVPALAVGAMYGLGADDALQFAQWAKDIFSNTPAAGPAFMGINGMLTHLIEQRKRYPQDDVLSAIVHWRDPLRPDDPTFHLTDKEMLDTAQMVQSAGHEMAAAWCTTALVHILSDRAFGTRTLRGRLSVDEALDSVLINASPTANTPCRFVKADVQIGGRMVHKGDAIVAAVGRATKEKHAGSDPVWDLTSKATLAWGAGAHRCPADRLSRIIVEQAIEAVLQRLSALRLTVPASELGVGVSLFSLRADRLPVEFDAVTQYDEQWNTTTAWAS